MGILDQLNSLRELEDWLTQCGMIVDDINSLDADNAEQVLPSKHTGINNILIYWSID